MRAGGGFNPGPHGFSEILYAFTSTSQNNGSAFPGISASSIFYNLTTAFAMFVGEVLVIVLTLTLPVRLSQEDRPRVAKVPSGITAPSSSSGSYSSFLLSGYTLSCPALSLGPVAEFLNMAGRRDDPCLMSGRIGNRMRYRTVPESSHRCIHQTGSPHPDPEPGDVHGGNRQRDHDPALAPGPERGG